MVILKTSFLSINIFQLFQNLKRGWTILYLSNGKVCRYFNIKSSSANVNIALLMPSMLMYNSHISLNKAVKTFSPLT